MEIDIEKTIVLKIGTSEIGGSGNGLEHTLIGKLGQQITYLRKKAGIPTVVVSSGAIAAGRAEFTEQRRILGVMYPEDVDNLMPPLTDAVVDRQFAAMIGQPQLMEGWSLSLSEIGMMVGQALLKDEDLDNFRCPLLRALRFGTIVVNGNDATYDPANEQEIISKDNDSLAREIARITGANKLIMLTEAQGVLDQKKKVIPEITCLEDLQRVGKFEPTEDGTGDIHSKILEARRHITDANKVAYIAGARIGNVILRAVGGERVGTKITLPLQGYLL